MVKDHSCRGHETGFQIQISTSSLFLIRNEDRWKDLHPPGESRISTTCHSSNLSGSGWKERRKRRTTRWKISLHPKEEEKKTSQQSILMKVQTVFKDSSRNFIKVITMLVYYIWPDIKNMNGAAEVVRLYLLLKKARLCAI